MIILVFQGWEGAAATSTHSITRENHSQWVTVVRNLFIHLGFAEFSDLILEARMSAENHIESNLFSI